MDKKLKLRNIITIEEKQILWEALDGMNGWNFNPIAVITNEIEDYYFICKVKTVVKNLEMKLAKVCIKIHEGNNPKLLAIESIL